MRVRAQYRIQRAALLPRIDAGASASASRAPAGGAAATSATGALRKDYSAGLSASWEVDFFGRLRSLSDAAFEQYLASAQARQAAQILLVSQVADQYLTVLAYDAELAVTQQTLEAAQGSYRIVKLQFDTGVASELALRQSQTTVDLATANHAAQLRLRAQAENALVLLVGQPLPNDLPPPLRPRCAADPGRYPGRPAVGPACAPPRYPAGRGRAALGERRYRRRQGRVLPADHADGQPGNSQP
jgi:multidrug efflux system outer membrane protein